MTREIILKALKNILAEITESENAVCYLNSEDSEVIESTIKELEQEPCGDCISRRAVLVGINRYIEKAQSTGTQDDFISFAELVVKELPPVNPQEPKTGRWIMPAQDDGMSDPIYYQVRCSECGFDLDPQTWHTELHQYGADNYCPNCGAKMENGK